MQNQIALQIHIQLWQGLGMMIAADIAFEIVALIGSILFGICAAIWFWTELH